MRDPVFQKHKWLLLPLCLCILFLAFAHITLVRERRERTYLPMVSAACTEFSVPVAMVMAVIRTESNFRPDAVSSAGAMGLMQLLPETFSYLCMQKLGEPERADEICNPQTNIRYGTYYLSYLYARFGSWRVALAAYNAGEGRVSEWLADSTLSQNNELLRIPFPETAAYVEKTWDAYETYLIKYPPQQGVLQ